MRACAPATCPSSARPASSSTSPCAAEQRVAQAQVGPRAVLHAGDDDDVPLAPRRARRREHRHRAAAGPAGGEGVGRAGPGTRGGRRTRAAAPAAAGRRRSRPRGTGPARRPGRGPRAHRPDRRRAPPGATPRPARRRTTAPTGRSARSRRGSSPPARPAASTSARRRGPRRTVAGSVAVRAGSPSISTSSASDARPPPPASSSARRARRSRRSPTASAPPYGEVSSAVAASASSVPGSSAQRSGEQQRSDRGLLAQRDVAAQHRHRDRRARERASQGGHLAAGPRDHGHPVPRHAALEVRAAQRVRDVRGLLGGAGQHRDPRRPRGSATWTGPVGFAGPGHRAAVPDARHRTDLLGDRRGHRAQRRALPPGRGQHERLGTELAEPASGPGRPAHQRGGRAAEGLHGLVGVGEQDDPGAVVGQDAQQPRGGRRALLVVVDHDQPPPRPRGAGDLPVPGEQRLGGLVDDDRGVEPLAGVRGRLPQAGDVEVLAVQPRGGHPLGALVPPAQRREVGRGQPALGGPHEQVAQLVAEAAQAEDVRGHGRGPVQRDAVARGVAGQQLAEQVVLLGAGDEGGRRLAEVGGPHPQDRERRRRGRPDHRLPGGALQPGREAVADVGRGAPGRDEHEDVVGGESQPVGRGDDRLDRGRRLAGAGRAEHQQGVRLGSRHAVDDGALVRVQRHRPLRRDRGPHEADGGGVEGGGAAHRRITSRATDTPRRDGPGRDSAPRTPRRAAATCQ